MVKFALYMQQECCGMVKFIEGLFWQKRIYWTTFLYIRYLHHNFTCNAAHLHVVALVNTVVNIPI